MVRRDQSGAKGTEWREVNRVERSEQSGYRRSGVESININGINIPINIVDINNKVV